MRVEGGEGVVTHLGLHALGAFADRLGLGDVLSARIPPAGERFPLHDPGKALVQAMLMLAGGGGEACTNIEHLRAQEALSGFVPSDSTLYRTFRHIGPATLAGLWEAIAEASPRCGRAVQQRRAPTQSSWISTRRWVQIRSENKRGTAATYKATSGSTR